MSLRTAVFWMGVALCAGSVEGLLRYKGLPEPWEAVNWQVYAGETSLAGSGPYVLDFSANWCRPCLEQRLTTFRDAAFASLIESLHLRPVRVSEELVGAIVFADLMKRFGVQGIPALVVVGRNGHYSVASQGVAATDKIADDIARALRRTERGLFWQAASSYDAGGRERLVIRTFDKWFLVDRTMSSDWRSSTRESFARWANENFDLVEDDYERGVAGVAYYKKFNIRAVPTVLVLDSKGAELARFEGAVETELAPGKIAARVRQSGLPVPDPPNAF